MHHFSLHYRRRLAADVAAANSGLTDIQQAKLQQRINVLQRRLEQWSRVQLLYMPLIARERKDDQDSTEPSELRPQSYKLYLPSEKAEISPRSLQSIEWKLRYAQAFDALEETRQYLRLRAYLLGFKRNNIRGQGSNTRARNTLKSVDGRVSASAEKCCCARNALKDSSHPLQKVGWETTLRVLDDEDLRSLTIGADGQSEGRRTISWIWQTVGVGDNVDAELQECKWNNNLCSSHSLAHWKRCELSGASPALG